MSLMPEARVEGKGTSSEEQGVVSLPGAQPECTKGWPLTQAQGRSAHMGFGPLPHGDTIPDMGCVACPLTSALAVLG